MRGERGGSSKRRQRRERRRYSRVTRRRRQQLHSQCSRSGGCLLVRWAASCGASTPNGASVTRLHSAGARSTSTDSAGSGTRVSRADSFRRTASRKLAQISPPPMKTPRSIPDSQGECASIRAALVVNLKWLGHGGTCTNGHLEPLSATSRCLKLGDGSRQAPARSNEDLEYGQHTPRNRHPATRSRGQGFRWGVVRAELVN